MARRKTSELVISQRTIARAYARTREDDFSRVHLKLAEIKIYPRSLSSAILSVSAYKFFSFLKRA